MKYLKLQGVNICFGMLWYGAMNAKKLNREDLLEKHSSSKSFLIKQDSRVAFGLIENSTIQQNIPPRLKSAAALMSRDLPNGVAIIDIPSAEFDHLYWGVLNSQGVSVVDHISENVDDVISVIIKHLNNPIQEVLEVREPLLRTSIPVSDLGDHYKELARIRNFRKSEWGYDDFAYILSQSKPNDCVVSDGVGGTLNSVMSNIGFIKNLKREHILGIVALPVMGYLAYDIFLSGSNMEDFEVDIPVVTRTPLISKDKKDPLEEAAKIAISKAMIGGKIDWWKKYKSSYEQTPRYISGYRKMGITCSLVSLRCETRFDAPGDYFNFPAAMNYLRSKYDDVVFTATGTSLIGVYKISRASLYTKVHKLEDLPEFDRGESALGPILKLSKTRPGFASSITEGKIINFAPEGSKNKRGSAKIDPLKSSFVLVGWQATGAYIHQSYLVESHMVRPFMAVNSFGVQRSEGGFESFSLSGAYLMKADLQGVKEK